MDRRFEKKVAVITGGAHGIGKSIADAFRADGATVHIIDLQPGDWFVGNVGDKDTLERFACYDNISELSDAVNRFIETGSALDDETKNIQEKAAWESKEHRDAEIRRARSILGIPNTPLNADKVKSTVELKAFKKKVQKVALSVIYLGLEGTGRFSEDELKKIFFSADLTMAEIESGTNTFENIEKELLNRMVKFELAKVNTTETTQTKEN